MTWKVGPWDGDHAATPKRPLPSGSDSQRSLFARCRMMSERETTDAMSHDMFVPLQADVAVAAVAGAAVATRDVPIRAAAAIAHRIKPALKGLHSFCADRGGVPAGGAPCW